MTTLYVVGTPIGNLEDITLRALRILKEVDVILCEDTRVTKRLLERYEITDKSFDHAQGRQLLTYNAERSGIRIEKVLTLLSEGKTIALVTDAGTPGISDPGSALVASVQKAGYPVIAIPGPSALTSAISVSGFDASQFLFLGFLPHKKGRETLFKEIAVSKQVIVLYESPHRIIKTLLSLKKYLQEKRRVFIAREITKIYDEGIIGTPEELLAYFEKHKEKIKGEFVVIVEGFATHKK